MKRIIELSGPRQAAADGGAARQVVVLLHGLGADGQDLIGLAREWSAVLPHATFVAPDGPAACDMAPFGRQWFSLQSFEPAAMLAGVRAAAPVVDAFIDTELARSGLDDSALALVGFSQGGAVALHVAMRRAKSCAAVIGYSSFLIAPELLANQLRARPPVLLVHGDADEIVPAGAQAQAETALRDAGVPVGTHLRPGLGHAIDAVGLSLGAAHLRTAFAAD